MIGELFLEIQLLLLGSALIWWAADKLWWQKSGFLSHLTRLRLARLVFGLSIAAPLVLSFAPRHVVVPFYGDLFEKRSNTPIEAAPAAANVATWQAQPLSNIKLNSPAENISVMLVILVLGLASVWNIRSVIRGHRQLARMIDRSLPVRRIGSVAVIAADITGPLAFRSKSKAYIALPESLLVNASHMSLALKHEGQHHRHGDTWWLQIQEALKFLLPLSPGLALWRHWIDNTQEFACDEALVGRKPALAHAYGSCLLHVAQTVQAISRRSVPFGALSMAARAHSHRHRSRLERRISMFRDYRPMEPSKLKKLMIGALTVTIAATTVTFAYAAKAERKIKALSLSEANALVATIPPNPDFPIHMNEHVLEMLNSYLTDPGRVNYLKETLERMPSYQAMIVEKLDAAKLPHELLAIPIVESGYRNLTTKNSGAGIWMIIRATGRKFGLKVNKQVDERMDPAKATTAALKLLSLDYKQFDQDWLLSLAAYNQGSGHVRSKITAAKHSDAWKLVEEKHLNDYLARFMAFLVVMKKPEILN